MANAVAKLTGKISRPRLRTVIIMCLALLIVGVVTYYAVSGRRNPEYQPTGQAQANQIDEDYIYLSDDEVAIKFKAETGLDAAVLSSAEANEMTYTKFQQSFGAGQAYQALDKNVKAYAAFQLADKQGSKAEKSYDFYIKYADIAAQNQQQEKSNQLLETAKEKLGIDTTLSSELKKEEIKRIDNVLRLRKLGY